MTKWPSSLFSDFTPGGALCTILLATLQLQSRMLWTHESLCGMLLPPDTGDRIGRHVLVRNHVAHFQGIRQQLLDKKLMVTPAVFLAPDIPHDEAQRLVAVVQARQGRITAHESEASHLVVRSVCDDDEDEEDDELQPRLLQTQGDLALIHWACCPDSYNEWVPKSEASSLTEWQAPQQSAPHRVTQRYLRDVDNYNEWLCVHDYAPRKDGDAARVDGLRQSAMGAMSGIINRAIEKKSHRFKGVYHSTVTQRWQVLCTLPGHGKQWVGSFEREEDAARAYDKLALKHIGYQKARINFDRSDYSELIQELRDRDSKVGRDSDRCVLS